MNLYERKQIQIFIYRGFLKRKISINPKFNSQDLSNS